MTPLMWAASECHLRAVALFLKTGKKSMRRYQLVPSDFIPPTAQTSPVIALLLRCFCSSEAGRVSGAQHRRGDRQRGQHSAPPGGAKRLRSGAYSITTHIEQHAPDFAPPYYLTRSL